MCKDTFQQHPQQWFQNYDRWVRLGPNLKNSFWYDQSNEIVFWTVHSKFAKYRLKFRLKIRLKFQNLERRFPILGFTNDTNPWCLHH